MICENGHCHIDIIYSKTCIIRNNKPVYLGIPRPNRMPGGGGGDNKSLDIHNLVNRECQTLLKINIFH